MNIRNQKGGVSIEAGLVAAALIAAGAAFAVAMPDAWAQVEDLIMNTLSEALDAVQRDMP